MNIDVFKSFDDEFKGALNGARSIDQVGESDRFQYNLVGCVWFSLLKEWSDLTDFLAYVRQHGLYETIDQCSTLSFQLLSHTFDFTSVPAEIASIMYGWTDHTIDGLSEDDIFYLATLLRYPKRLCVGDDSLKTRCIGDFLIHNKELGKLNKEMRKWLDKHPKDYDSNDLRGLTIGFMRDHILKWIGRSPYGDIPITIEDIDQCKNGRRKTHMINVYNKAVENYNQNREYFDEEDFADLPTGVCADAKTGADKLSVLVSRKPLAYPGVSYIPNDIEREITHMSFDRFQHPIIRKGGRIVDAEKRIFENITYIRNSEVAFGEVTAVPKTYDEYRIVVKEQSYRLSKSKKLEKFLANKLKVASKGAVDVNDQSVNQEAARLGSVDGSTATIDWSHASDGYCVNICRSVLPEQWFDAISARRAQYLLVRNNDKKYDMYQNNIFLTMGHTLTPAVQSLLFYSLAYAAADIFTLFTGEKVDTSRISVYNDDTVVPTEIAELVFDCGKAIGLKPNEKKSFCSTDFLFREACGVEYFEGRTLTQHLYWPRTRIDVSSSKDLAKHFPTLMSIQHAVFNKRAASNGLCDLYSRLYPNMTWSSGLRDDTTDLVRFHRTVEKVFPPVDYTRVYDRQEFDKFLMTNDITREMHLRARSTWPRRKGTDIYLAEYYCYLLYLKEGPFYEDEWMRLAHCSTRRNPDQFITESVTQVSSVRT